MNIAAMLEEIRALALRETAVSEETKAFLARSQCLYLLCRTGDPACKALAARNEWVLAERCKLSAGVFRELEAEGIPYAQIKGAPLGKLAYGAAGMRRSSDIDLLVAGEDLPRVKPLLKRNGFLQARLTRDGVVPYSREEIVFYGLTTHQTAPFVKTVDSKAAPYLEIDLNTDLFWGEAHARTDMRAMLTHTVRGEAIPGFPVFLLEAPYAFASLCLHHYKDMNSIYLLYERNGFDFSQFCDVFFFFVNQLKPYAVETLRTVWEGLRALPFVYWMLYYTARIFPDDVLQKTVEALETPAGTTLLDCYGLDREERNRWELSFEERVFHPALREYLLQRASDRELEKIRQNHRYL